MQGQLIDNWNDLYQNSKVPQWEDLEPNRDFLSLVQTFSAPQMKVLEIGCGLGHNALALARTGIDITASDFSKNAVERCAEMAHMEGIVIQCRTLDIMCLPSDIGKCDLVFDKGCWHTFFTKESREKYVLQMCSLLTDGGLWINSSGSADNIDSPNDPNVDTYPRWTLGEIAQLVEPRFEILRVRRGRYGYREGNSFYTWESVFRKKANKPL